MKNTALTKKEKQILEQICKLQNFSISDCEEFLFCKTENSHLGIKIEKISYVEETKNVYRIFKDRDVITVFKDFQHIVISLP